nr:copia protein [Tanacetum cinerariifolium]
MIIKKDSEIVKAKVKWKSIALKAKKESSDEECLTFGSEDERVRHDVDDDLDEKEAIKVIEKKNLENNIVDETLEIDEIVSIKESRNHPLENAIGNLNQRTLRSQAQNKRTKWVFRSKLDENGIVSRYKARLVAQEYNQQEGIDYDETYALVARLESIRILLAYVCTLDFKLFQMDIKSAFLNDFINKEVYVAQPLGFINFEKLDHVYKLKKALYGLKQAPKAWYDRLKVSGMVDNTLFTKKKSSNLIIVQIYVDDIIFGLTCQDMCDEFAKIMHEEFKMRMTGELNFFLGLQVKQMEDGSCLTSWFSKKQTALAISTTESEYVSVGKACAIDLSKNPMQHSRIKHIEIRYHHLRDNVQKGHILIEKVSSVDNIADILTKPLKRELFNYLRLGLEMMEHIP